MSLKCPADPFLTDALGAARWCRECLKRQGQRKDFDAAIYWSARWAFHWAQKSHGWVN